MAQAQSIEKNERKPRITKATLKSHGIEYYKDMEAFRTKHSCLPDHVNVVREGLLDFKGFLSESITREVLPSERNKIPTSAYTIVDGSDYLESWQVNKLRHFIKTAKKISLTSKIFTKYWFYESAWQDLFKETVFQPTENPLDKATSPNVSFRKHVICKGNAVAQWNKARSRDSMGSGLTTPRPDFYFGFSIYDIKAHSAVGFEKLDFIRNFTADSLYALSAQGLQAAPTSGFAEHMAGREKNRRKNGVVPGEDMLCFPYGVVELKRSETGGISQKEDCYCQAANGGSAALTMMENLAKFAPEQEGNQHVPPILCVTSVGAHCKVWLSFSQTSPGGDRNHPMVCIWSGVLENVWDSLQFCRIMENATCWAESILRPKLSHYIDLWQMSSMVPSRQNYHEHDLQISSLVNQVQNQLMSLQPQVSSNSADILKLIMTFQKGVASISNATPLALLPINAVADIHKETFVYPQESTVCSNGDREEVTEATKEAAGGRDGEDAKVIEAENNDGHTLLDKHEEGLSTHSSLFGSAEKLVARSRNTTDCQALYDVTKKITSDSTIVKSEAGITWLTSALPEAPFWDHADDADISSPSTPLRNSAEKWRSIQARIMENSFSGQETSDSISLAKFRLNLAFPRQRSTRTTDSPVHANETGPTIWEKLAGGTFATKTTMPIFIPDPPVQDAITLSSPPSTVVGIVSVADKHGFESVDENTSRDSPGLQKNKSQLKKLRKDLALSDSILQRAESKWHMNAPESLLEIPQSIFSWTDSIVRKLVYISRMNSSSNISEAYKLGLRAEQTIRGTIYNINKIVRLKNDRNAIEILDKNRLETVEKTLVTLRNISNALTELCVKSICPRIVSLDEQKILEPNSNICSSAEGGSVTPLAAISQSTQDTVVLPFRACKESSAIDKSFIKCLRNDHEASPKQRQHPKARVGADSGQGEPDAISAKHATPSSSPPRYDLRSSPCPPVLAQQRPREILT